MSSGEPSENPRPPILEEAWRRFAVYDLNATRLQRGFLRMRGWITALGVLATVFAVSDAVLPDMAREHTLWPLRRVLHLMVLVAPITGGVLFAGASRLDRSMSWVLLRGSAETLKREIYRYRARVGPFSGAAARDEKLAAKLESVARRLMSSEVTLTSLRPYKGGELPPPSAVARGEDGYSELSAEAYLEVRLRDQLAYYRNRARRFERQHRVLQWWIAGLGGLGTLFAATGLEIWIPVCVSMAAAFGAYLDLRRVETWMATFSRSAMELENVATWWKQLSAKERASDANRERLVNRTEAVLRTENADWQEEMEDALEALDQEGGKWWTHL